MPFRQTGIVFLAVFLQLAISGWVTIAGEAEGLTSDDPEIPFDYETFYAREEVARWLLRYDRVAWLTTDLVMTEPEVVLDRLGSDWFCLVLGGRWHAVYGGYDSDNDKYDAVLQYAATDEGFTKLSKPLPQKHLTPLGRALYNVGRRLKPVLRDVGVRFNQYARRIEDDQIEIWVLPGWQADGRFVFGTEYRFVLDKRGRKILEQSAPEPNLTVENLTPEMKLLFSNDDSDVPSVGQIFAMLLARDHVALAGIRSRDYVSVLVDIPSTGRQAWVHVYREYELEASIQMITEFATHDMSAAASVPGLAFELDERLLGVSHVPFKVGQTITTDELSAQSCVESENGLVVCPIAKGDSRGFSIVVEKTSAGRRVIGVLSYWKCDPAKCPAVFKETVAALTEQLGAEPGLLEGAPIWRDREKNQRDLMVQMMESDMISIVLVESD